MRHRERLCLAIGGLALLVSVLAVGGVLRWTQAVVAGLVGAALSVQLIARRQLDRTSPLVVLLGAATLLTAIQLIPLPGGVLDALDPTGNHLRDTGAAIAHTSPWHVISLDPPATLSSVAFFITLLGVALISLRIAASEKGRFALLGAVAMVCGIAAIVAGVHTLVGADALYGLYEPLYTKGEPIMGPLLNPNHMGGLMAIGTVLSLSLAFYNSQPIQLRVLWIVNGFGCALVAAASLSRGAMLGLVLGLIVASLLLFTRRSASSPRARRNDGPIILVILLGLGVAFYSTAGNVIDQLDSTSVTELNVPTSKFAAWKSSLALVRESPWVGVGRGAVEATLTRVHEGSSRATFSHLENEYLTAVVEWGVPGALIIAAIAVWCFVTALRRWRDGPLAAAALGAIAAIAFQSSVDFGIELLGLAVPVVIIASTVQLVPLRGSASSSTRWIRFGMIGLLACCAVVMGSRSSRSLREDHELIEATVPADLNAIHDSIENHPLDYMGFGEQAVVMWEAGDVPHTVAYLNQGLSLHPHHAGLHQLAAELLVGAKRYKQAAFEYSEALRNDPTPLLLVQEIVRSIPDADLIAASLPLDYPSLDVMLHVLSDVQRDDIAEKWLRLITLRPEHDLHVIDMLYDIEMNRKDYGLAMETAQVRWMVAHTTSSRLMVSRVQFELKQYEPLLASLGNVASWSGRLDEKAHAWFILCDVYTARSEWNEALECIHRLDASGLIGRDRSEVTKRLDAINEGRTVESKNEAIKALTLRMPNAPKHYDPGVPPPVLPVVRAPQLPTPTPAPKLP